MAVFSFDAPTPTVGLPADWALRMRVRRSASGSVMLICAPHQLALDRPGISPRLAASRSLVRARPNLRYTPRERPVMAQRLRCRLLEASRGCCCSSAVAAARSSDPVFGSRISSFSAARRLAYFFAILRRFFSRMSMFVFAMGYLLAERKVEGF